MQSFRIGIVCGVVLVAVLSTSLASADERHARRAHTIESTLVLREESLIELRRDLHRHPELSGQEKRTAEVLAKRMLDLGLTVKTDVGGHGVMALLEGDKPGPVVAYRADMDAIPSTGPDPVPFASKNEEVRHGCGHDLHMTIAVGIAEALVSVRHELRGSVKFIFQPAEENAVGAAAVIADGALDDPEPEAIFAVHCAPLEVGTIGSRPGMLLGGLDTVEITLSGDGDIDAVVKEINALFAGINTVDFAGSSGEMQEDFVMAGLFNQRPSGDGTMTLVGMVRASSEEQHDRARAELEKGVDAIDVAGVVHEFSYNKYSIPPVMNDTALLERANTIITQVAGADALQPISGVTPFFSEDFSHFQKKIPGAMYFLGVSNSEKGTVGLPHSPMFVPDEGAIVFGARVMANVLADYLERHAQDS